MPAKTPAKKASSAKKPAPKKAVRKQTNGVSAATKPPAPPAPTPPPNLHAAEADALRAEAHQLQAQVREASGRTAALEKELADARASGARLIDLEKQLRDAQTRLTTRQAELEASRVEAANLRDAVAKARSQPPPPARLACPKCGGRMIEYQHDVVKADRCETCHGIYFDNGELDEMMKHHDDQLLAGRKHWYSSFFGKK